MADTIAPVAPVAGQNTTNSADTPPANPQMDSMARKERQLRKLQVDLQKQKQDLESRAKSYETDYIPRSRLKEDPWSVLQAEGMDYDQLTQQLLQQPQDPATKALMSKIKQLEDKQSAAERAATENTQAQYTQALKQISNDVKLLIDSDPEFESVKSLGQSGIDAVTELIEQTFQADGYLMDHVEAAKKIEDYLVEEGYKMSQLKKVQARLKPVEAPKPAAPAKVNPSNRVTITQSMQTTPAKSNSASDRRARAMAAFLGKNS
jgi:hypothetical protein